MVVQHHAEADSPSPVSLRARERGPGGEVDP